MKTLDELRELYGELPHKDCGTRITMQEFCDRLWGMSSDERYDYLSWWMYGFVGREESPGVRTVIGINTVLADINGMLQQFKDRSTNAGD